MRYKYRKYKVELIQFILIGFFLFGLKVFAELIYHSLQRVLAFLGLIMIFVSPFMFRERAINPIKGKIKIIYNLFLLWILLIVLRPFLMGEHYTELMIHPYFPYGLTSFLLPLIVLIDLNFRSINMIFKGISIFALVGIIYFIVNYNNMLIVLASGIIMGFDGEIGVNNLADSYYVWFAASSFSLLSLEFLSKKQKWFVLFSNLFMFFLLILFARRSGVFMYVLYFLGLFYLYINRLDGYKKLNIILLILLIIVSVIYMFMYYSDALFTLFFDRLNEDSRSGVDISVINYLNDEHAWVVGNGIEASYSHPGFNEPRYVHETGYLYMIMKGGVIYLSLYIILLLNAFYNGFFKSKNRFTKGMALYALFHIIFLIPYGLPNFSLEYLLVWISFALCQNSKLRSLSDQQLTYYLKINN